MRNKPEAVKTVHEMMIIVDERRRIIDTMKREVSDRLHQAQSICQHELDPLGTCNLCEAEVGHA